MSAKRIELILILCLLLGVLTCLLGYALMLPKINLRGNPNNRSVKDLTITMDASQREEYFSQMRKFAEKHSLRFEFASYSSDNKIFIIAMYGNGFHITSADVTHSSDVAISLFNETFTPTPQATVDELFDDLKNFINEIPNVRMSEVRKSLRIRMDESQREELFTQMRKLADEHSLEFTLSFSSDKSLYHAEIRGNGFHITSDPRSSSSGENFVAFFLDYHQAPTPASVATVDELSNELKSSLREIPNVTITEEK